MEYYYEITYVGQAGFLISLDNKKICFDIYLSDFVYETTGTGVRNYTSPFEIEEFYDVDYYFISHEHADHLDTVTIKKLAEYSPDIIYVCPKPCVSILRELGIVEEKILGMEAFDEISISKNCDIVAIPEKHEEYRMLDGCYMNLGYVIKIDKKSNLFFAGDAIADIELIDILKRYSPFKVVFLPINGHDWKRRENNLLGNMNYREALDLCDCIGSEMIVPMHYDMFDDNTENPAYFVDYLYRNHFGQNFKMFMPGETIVMKK